MKDTEYLFNQTAQERKRIGRGDKNKKRGSGRYVRMPSDNLSRKERQAMNGEVKTYRMKDFYTWEEFIELPDDIKADHINRLVKKYGAGLKTISVNVFGKSENALRKHLERNGVLAMVNAPKRGQNTSGGNRLARDVELFFGVAKKITPADSVKTTEKHEENNIAALLALLAGTGAKLTIDVTL